MTPAQSEIAKLSNLLKIEKDEDYAQYQRKMLNTSLDQRKKEGVTWYPVVVVNRFISTGERFTLELDRTANIDQNHAFQTGSVVSLFSNHDEEDTVSAVVSFVRKNKMRIVLNGANLPDWLNQGKLGVNLLFDEGTYREMGFALKDVLTAEKGRLADLRELFYGAKPLEFKKGFEYQSVHLNEIQNQALTKVFNAKDVAIIHGPPGTGKTTTLVHAIKEVVKTEKQVLVSAQSNAAVDLLVEKLAEQGLNVLRIGHPARLTPEVIENSLDVKISHHPFFRELKEIRKKEEEYKRMAHQYKRNFGREERYQRDLLKKEARLYRDDAKRIERHITDDLVDQAQVIACTLVGTTHSLVKDRVFKTVFIDEASQALEPACWIAIRKAYRVVMAGDHMQLPPTVKSLKAGKEGLENTLFEKAMKLPDASVMLETQYRMHPHIMQFSSDNFYQGGLKTAEEVMLRERGNTSEHFAFIDTAGCGFAEKVKKETLSTFNEEEAALLLKHLAENLPEDGQTVGIIAPYKAQVEKITDLLKEEAAFDLVREQITVNSVDAFQGQERDIMYISLTRSNDKGEIGFLKEYRRMNVAMTRAKTRLVIIGDSATLGKDSFFNNVIDYAQKICGYHSAFEFLY
ncbi:AAA domain-containing protein [Roseivirga pacifica]|uniref:AAA domain-containing protein n=1 Tax=Roseivirga pacifica TaxID=1267423 RepID=UPI0020947D7A|nr:AAA domain-containing protein [Roseivirga pacifica]MCO6360158.1 AAA family ATPase [Roseivirga pacifica]MCO6367529.1 AAA family ATPase [Roseivirga pacifica]MCO6369940.1 AAA family ATPase [Roseivirga pacifica]MCO6375185.1 AAA family ATPase [Roseivirga pacifica]MCO6380444.1 AAA family ATPase [Roseivirga pacifica]